MTFKQPKPQKDPEPRGDVEVGDHLYVHHGGQPCTGVVCAHGRHGVTVKIDGQHHKVKWDKVLGHKRRASKRYSVVDHGEDGMLVEDDQGRRRFVAIPNDSKDDPMVAKSFGQRPVLLFMKAGAPPGPAAARRRPGGRRRRPPGGRRRSPGWPPQGGTPWRLPFSCRLRGELSSRGSAG